MAKFKDRRKSSNVKTIPKGQALIVNEIRSNVETIVNRIKHPSPQNRQTFEVKRRARTTMQRGQKFRRIRGGGGGGGG